MSFNQLLSSTVTNFASDIGRVTATYPDLYLGPVPIKFVTNMWVGFSHGEMRYRSIGALFLAHHKAQFEDVAIRFTCILTGPSRFIQLQMLKSLFDYSNMEQATETIDYEATGWKKMWSILRFPTRWMRRTVLNKSGRWIRKQLNGGVAEKIKGKEIAKNYIHTYPLLCEDVFLPYVYIETLTWQKSTEYPDTLEVDVLLRTWRNDWKEATRGGVIFSRPTSNQSIMVGTMARMLWRLVTGPMMASVGKMLGDVIYTPIAMSGSLFQNATRMLSTTENPWAS
ncbi:MAG: hypothetical protein ACXQS8_06785 [Candidatus Helarchaeales archaeon]